MTFNTLWWGRYFSGETEREKMTNIGLYPSCSPLSISFHFPTQKLGSRGIAVAQNLPFHLHGMVWAIRGMFNSFHYLISKSQGIHYHLWVKKKKKLCWQCMKACLFCTNHKAKAKRFAWIDVLDKKLVLKSPRYAKKISLTHLHHNLTFDTAQDWSMYSCCLCQILTLPTKVCSRKWNLAEWSALLLM